MLISQTPSPAYCPLLTVYILTCGGSQHGTFCLRCFSIGLVAKDSQGLCARARDWTWHDACWGGEFSTAQPPLNPAKSTNGHVPLGVPWGVERCDSSIQTFIAILVRLFLGWRNPGHHVRPTQVCQHSLIGAVDSTVLDSI
jgi:hypothetical protein